MSTAAVRRLWNRVAELGCVVCGGPAEIMHAHGGSMVPIMGPHAKGKKLARYDFLVLPGCPKHHRVEYGGLDANVRAWELEHGTQVEHLHTLGRTLKMDLFKLAGETIGTYIHDSLPFVG